LVGAYFIYSNTLHQIKMKYIQETLGAGLIVVGIVLLNNNKFVDMLFR